jgi:hypothetical protein
MLVVVAAGARAAVGRTSFHEQIAGTCDPANSPCFRLESTIVFTSTRDNPTGTPLLAGEIYVMNPDGTDPRRLCADLPGYARRSRRSARLLRGTQAQQPADLAIRLPRREARSRAASRAPLSRTTRQPPSPIDPQPPSVSSFRQNATVTALWCCQEGAALPGRAPRRLGACPASPRPRDARAVCRRRLVEREPFRSRRRPRFIAAVS